MFDRRKKAIPAQDAGLAVYVGEARQSGRDMTPQSDAIFYVLMGLLFLPLGIAYGCYLLYRFIHEHM